MTQLIIRRLYEVRLKTAAELRDLPCKYQNESFDPPNNADPEDNVYLAAYQLPSNTRSPDLAGDLRTFSGLYQFSVVTPKGIGAGVAGDIIAWLNDLFPLNLQLTDPSGLVVQIITPLSEGVGLEGDSDYTVATSFEYRSL